jgi:hypothetical protein
LNLNFNGKVDIEAIVALAPFLRRGGTIRVLVISN